MLYKHGGTGFCTSVSLFLQDKNSGLLVESHVLTCKGFLRKVPDCLHGKAAHVPLQLAGQESSSSSTSRQHSVLKLFFILPVSLGPPVISCISPVVMMLGVYRVHICRLSILFRERSPPGSYRLSDQVLSFSTAEYFECRIFSQSVVCLFTSWQVLPIENSFSFDQVLLNQFSLLWIALWVLI